MPFTEQKHHKKNKNTRKINKQIETNLSKKNINEFSYENIAKTTPYEYIRLNKNAPAVARDARRTSTKKVSKERDEERNHVSPYGKFRRELVDISKGEKTEKPSKRTSTPSRAVSSSKRTSTSYRSKGQSLTTTIDQYMTDKILKERMERRSKEKEKKASLEEKPKTRQKSKGKRRSKEAGKGKYNLDTVDMLLEKLPMDE